MKFALIASLFLAIIAASLAQQTVYDVIQSDSSFSRLKQALDLSTDPAVQDLVSRLKDNATATTFFAPNNNAFTANGTVTASFLSYYLVPQDVSALADGQVLATLAALSSLNNQTQRVRVTKSGNAFNVNGNSPVQQSIAAVNGFVYGIGQNLTVPVDLLTVVNGSAVLSTLNQLVQLAGVGSVVRDTAGLTAFAPTNTAFGNLPRYVFDYLGRAAADSKAMLIKVLQYHLAGSLVYLGEQATNSSQAVTTLEGLTVQVAVSASRAYTVNSAKVALPDVLASNGVAHVIDQVLVPSDLGFTVANALVGLSATTIQAYVAALQNASLLTTLNNVNTPFTVFAPSTVPDASSASLNYTIVPGTFKAADLKDGQLLTTLSVKQGSLDNNGQVLKVSINNGKVYIQGVEVTMADVGAGVVANGVIHLLGGALTLPGTVADVAGQTASLSTLDTAVVLAGLAGALNAPGNLTVFAPTNDAFAALPASILGYLTSNSSKASNAALAHVLLYHVYGKGVLYYNLGNGNLKPNTYTMLSGGDVTVSEGKVGNNTVVKVNSAQVVLPDVPTSNGVVHVINGVLVPSDLNVTSSDLLVGLGDTTLIGALNKTGLLANLNTLKVTIFAPTNSAFDKLKDKSILTNADMNKDLSNLLLTHVVNETVAPSRLFNGAKFWTLSGKQLVITSSDNKTFSVNIAGPDAKTAGSIDLAASSSSLGSATSSYVYSIDQVLGETDKSDDDSGLTSTEIGLIVAGCIVAVLLAGAFIGGAVWYWKRRNGYEQIDADTY